MATRSGKIAVIDDTQIVREVIAHCLAQLGWTPLQAADGEKGLQLIRSETPDLVLCDLRMPNLDGLGLLEAVKREFPDLPVIVISGAGLLQDAIGAVKLGAWDYISKPIELVVLEHAIDRAMERAALIAENRRNRARLEQLNHELKTSLRLLAEDEDAGRQIQFRMLPRNHLRFGNYHVSHGLVPSAFLSGDFLDAFTIDEKRWGFYLADVSGHGVSSALVTVLLRTFVQRQVASYAQSGDDAILSPARMLMQLNEEMARDDLEKHLTIFYAVIDLESDRLVYANAGHFPWPILCDGDKIRVLEHPAVPVGIISGSKYREHAITLPPRMSLSVFSDGVLEVMTQPSMAEKLAFLREFFGRLDVSVEAAREELHLDGRASLPDDIALLIIQRKENGGSHATV